MCDLQFLASSPDKSSWISASAGSGKTKVLIDRLMRLLIKGEPFSSILCFTYTNAAASEMKDRLQKKLYEFSQASDKILEMHLRTLLRRSPTDLEKTRIRNLYDEFMKNSNILRIQTIHSFCKDFLTQFSFYAEIYSSFTVLESSETQKLLKSIQEKCLIEEDDSEFQRHFQILSQYLTFEQIDDFLLALLSKRYDFSQFLKNYESAQFISFLQKKFEISHKFERFNEQKIQEIAKILAGTSSLSESDQKTLQLILKKHYFQVFLTKGQIPRKKIFSVSLQKQYKEFYTQLYEQGQHYIDDLMQQKTQELIAKTQAFIYVANIVFQRYQDFKIDQNQYDFEDLIMKTNYLLEKILKDSSFKKACFHFFPIRHLFVDEAQDTSPQQWQIVLQIVHAFFKESGGTLFVVGDIKQSIYSFQGSKPWLFQTLSVVFQKLIENYGGIFQIIHLQTSYRTAPIILNVVDSIFQKNPKGIKFEEDYRPHHSARHTTGFVENFFVSVQGKDENEEELLAHTVVQCITHLLKQKIFLPSVNRNIKPDDILILSRKRSPILSMIRKKLQIEQIPVAGQDRIQVSKNLIWFDLLAFVEFLVNPYDDYNLACLLKTPFLQHHILSEDQLFSLCYNRQKSLFETILEKKDKLSLNIKSLLLPYREESQKIINKNLFYNFFHRVLSHIRPYYEEIFQTTSSIFEIFLEAVLNFLDQNFLNLSIFSEFLQKNIFEGKIKEHRPGIQFMTVHGAKGLQSPLVILIDSLEKVSLQKEKWCWFEREDVLEPPQGMILMPSLTISTKAVAQIREKALESLYEEDKRLLYVAMTRAQDGLISIGFQKEGSWSLLISEALNRKTFLGKYEFSSENPQEEPFIPVQSFNKKESLEETPFIPRINFIKKLLPSEEASRGILIHKFIQEMAFKKFDQDSAYSWFLEHASALKINNQIINSLPIQRFLQLPYQKEFFYIKKGKSEVSLQENGKIFRLDHLYRDNEKIVIIEVKTSQEVPHRHSSIPFSYQEQLDNYCKIVSKIFSHRKILSYFLWTETMNFMPFSYADFKYEN